ncbi:unnamed protein product [Bursaphelenchus xylophilus]|uniref:(pine wood nematode) hypothetical protein n=1 Tax=Bursaphelenchus xylophilus TaxID=6326 RepID=A0A1I7RLH6_BURXY|nr:unnamed protein product [Bursaphelenchus xylophilus]CAG9082977.1 unnamed protein product [Bursaphelenchus xylophilus]
MSDPDYPQPSSSKSLRKRRKRSESIGKRKPTDGRTENVKFYEQRVLSALVADVDTLHEDFLKTPTWSYRDFSSCFLNREFSTIFLGRMNAADLIEFSEILLLYSSSFIFTLISNNNVPKYVKTTNSNELAKIQPCRKQRLLKDRVFGIYLTYTLFFTQPQNNIANIKVTVNQMAELEELCQSDLVRNECLEALFCVHRLVNHHAFMIKPFEQDFNPLLARRFNLEELLGEGAQVDTLMSDPLSALHNLLTDSTLEQADVIHQTYNRLKVGMELPEGIDLVKDGLMSRVKEILEETVKELDDM